jgi:hypothetical protein
MALESREESRALIVVGKDSDPPSPVNTDVAPAGAVAVGVLAAVLTAAGIALGRALYRSVTRARRTEGPPTIAIRASDTEGLRGDGDGGAIVRVTRVSMVVVEEWVTRGRAGGS